MMDTNVMLQDLDPARLQQIRDAAAQVRLHDDDETYQDRLHELLPWLGSLAAAIYWLHREMTPNFDPWQMPATPEPVRKLSEIYDGVVQALAEGRPLSTIG